MIQIDLGVLGILMTICFSFGGFVLSNKLTGFGASYQALALVATISVLLSLIPSFGWVISLAATFFMLRAQSNNGVILMMIVSWIMMAIIIAAMVKIF